MAQAMPGKQALVVCTENVTAGFSASELGYPHQSNAIFRMGGAAIVLSNRYRPALETWCLHCLQGFQPAQVAQQKVS